MPNFGMYQENTVNNDEETKQIRRRNIYIIY